MILKKCGSVNSVFHLAAMAGIRNSMEHPEEYYETNVEGTACLLDHFSSADDLVFASSSSVYGNPRDEDLPVSEAHSPSPISPYSDSKKQAEEMCLKYAEENKIRTSILRFYTTYGPRQRPDEAIMKFIGLCIRDEPVPVYGDGTKMRDYIFVSDLVDGVILAQKHGGGTFNLGSGHPISINEMISTIEKNLGKKAKRVHLDPPRGDIEKTHADISKAEKRLGFSPGTGFESGIIRSIRWYRQRYAPSPPPPVGRAGHRILPLMDVAS